MTKSEKRYREAVDARVWAESVNAPNGYLIQFRLIERHRKAAWDEGRLEDVTAPASELGSLFAALGRKTYDADV